MVIQLRSRLFDVLYDVPTPNQLAWHVGEFPVRGTIDSQCSRLIFGQFPHKMSTFLKQITDQVPWGTLELFETAIILLNMTACLTDPAGLDPEPKFGRKMSQKEKKMGNGRLFEYHVLLLLLRATSMPIFKGIDSSGKNLYHFEI